MCSFKKKNSKIFSSEGPRKNVSLGLGVTFDEPAMASNLILIIIMLCNNLEHLHFTW